MDWSVVNLHFVHGFILLLPDWGRWGDYSKCSASCGLMGTKTRTRRCEGGNTCEGEAIQTVKCNRISCAGCCLSHLISLSCLYAFYKHFHSDSKRNIIQSVRTLKHGFMNIVGSGTSESGISDNSVYQSDGVS